MVARKETSSLDLLTEDTLPITQAAQHLPGRPSAATLYRWRNKGVNGIKLETIAVGGKVYTSQQAIHRFLSKTQP